MVPDVSHSLSWLEDNPHLLQGIQRGIERETLRVTPTGALAQTPHPAALGQALTHGWITTDFAEALLEFITPVDSNLPHTFDFLHDLHRHASRLLGDERLWPLSMPCQIDDESQITLAQYGTSNEGRFKTVYREGLKNRYGALMQIIAGVHYNFSLPDAYWQARLQQAGRTPDAAARSDHYFALIRNYYRFGWVIPYLFGASPAVNATFLRSKSTSLPFERMHSGDYYLPYATSLRLSDLGYTNHSPHQQHASLNRLDEYVADVRRALHTHSPEYARIGVKTAQGHYRQLNDNVLQIENEHYAPIRPKRVARQGESVTAALLRDGVQYIEVRSLDVNPFSPVGIDIQQARFLDLFLIWCELAASPPIDVAAVPQIQQNWQRVVLEGRKPGLTLHEAGKTVPLAEVGHRLFNDLERIAAVLDQQTGGEEYRTASQALSAAFDDPQRTCSARLLEAVLPQGVIATGLELAERYHAYFAAEPLRCLSDVRLEEERQASVKRQQALEESDTMPFDAYVSAQTRDI